MRYGVLSDVHSNLEALTAAVGALKAAGAEAWIGCGDFVGYGADPNACLDLVRGLPQLRAIAGNHDLAAIGRIESEWFNPQAKAAVLWTGRALSAENRRWLEGLSARLEAPEFTLAHGSPRNPVEEYLLSPLQFKDNAPLVKRWPLFVGHSHMPLVFRFQGDKPEARFLEDHEERLPRAEGGLIGPVALNPGSVGQPRDQDPRAACGLYDSVAGTFRVLRLPYDVRAAQEKIRAAGLPEYLALRLAYGQ